MVLSLFKPFELDQVIMVTKSIKIGLISISRNRYICRYNFTLEEQMLLSIFIHFELDRSKGRARIKCKLLTYTDILKPLSLRIFFQDERPDGAQFLHPF